MELPGCCAPGRRRPGLRVAYRGALRRSGAELVPSGHDHGRLDALAAELGATAAGVVAFGPVEGLPDADLPDSSTWPPPSA